MSDVAIRARAKAISEADMAHGRTIARIQVATAVWSLWDRLRLEKGLDQQWLADRLGKDKSRVSRLLKGPGNWTLDTVGDLLEAMGGRLTSVEAHTYDDIAQGRQRHSALGASRRIVRITTIEISAEGTDQPDSIEYDSNNGAAIDLPRPWARSSIEQVEPA